MTSPTGRPLSCLLSTGADPGPDPQGPSAGSPPPCPPPRPSSLLLSSPGSQQGPGASRRQNLASRRTWGPVPGSAGAAGSGATLLTPREGRDDTVT